jgi:hypothetical protein
MPWFVVRASLLSLLLATAPNFRLEAPAWLVALTLVLFALALSPQLRRFFKRLFLEALKAVRSVEWGRLRLIFD